MVWPGGAEGSLGSLSFRVLFQPQRDPGARQRGHSPYHEGEPWAKLVLRVGVELSSSRSAHTMLAV